MPVFVTEAMVGHKLASSPRRAHSRATSRRPEGEAAVSTVTEYPSATAVNIALRARLGEWARRVIDLVRGKSVEEALDILRWRRSRQRAGRQGDRQCRGQRPEQQRSGPSHPGGGHRLRRRGAAKRIRPRAQGRAYRIRKRTSHITVIVESRPPRGERAGQSTRSRRAQGSKAAAGRATTAKKGGSQ